MVHYEGVDAGPGRFQRFDWQLQLVFVGWSVGVALLMLGIHLLTTNASLLSIGP